MTTSKTITLAHGSGGKASSDLIRNIFVKAFNNKYLASLQDQAKLPSSKGKLVLTTDSFVVKPIFFPGGDIGKLAVTGTVNDLAMSGATAKYLTCGLIIEEGLTINTLEQIINSMQQTAIACGVKVVCGDTKVVETGSADKIYINTAGVGFVDEDLNIASTQAKVGDKIIVNGFIGDHGAAILQARADLAISSDLISDCQPLDRLVQKIIKATPTALHCMRDATRGGVATVLNEIAQDSAVGIKIFENQIPVREQTRAICEILGLDSLYLANEGTLVAMVDSEQADLVLSTMRQNPEGKNAQIIGEVVADHKEIVVLNSIFGGNKILDKLVGDQFPRIC